MLHITTSGCSLVVDSLAYLAYFCYMVMWVFVLLGYVGLVVVDLGYCLLVADVVVRL